MKSLGRLQLEVDVSRSVCRRQCVEGVAVVIVAVVVAGSFAWLATVCAGPVAVTFAVFAGLWSVVMGAAAFQAVDAWRSGRNLLKRRSYLE